MSRRDEPAFPTLIGWRPPDGGFAEFDCYHGITKFEHTVIEMALALRVGFRCARPGDLASGAIEDAAAIWDALEARDNDGDDK